MLKAVTFDLWGTLMMDRPVGIRMVKAERIRRIGEVLRQEQIIRDPEAIVRAYNSVGDRLAVLWTELRDLGARDQVELLLDILLAGEHVSRPDSLMEPLVEAYTLPILSELPVPVDGAPNVLSALEGRGLRMAVICNTGRTPGKILRIILERLGLGRYLSVQTFSDELRLRKPHPEIFLRTLSALGVEPPEARHVGDTMAAHGIGMRAVHLCHALGADPNPGETETIFSLPELLPLIDTTPARLVGRTPDFIGQG
jgi:putative hydrolase of the HAD superfamily